MTPLIKQLQTAKAGGVMLERAIGRALFKMEIWRGCTRTLNEAVSLLRAALPGWYWTIGLCDLSGHCTIGPDYNGPAGERLKREFPVEHWNEGINMDLEPGGTIDRVCLALCAAILIAKLKQIRLAG